LTVLDNYGSGSPLSLGQAVLPVDVAQSPDGSQLAIAAAGTGFASTASVWLLSGDGQSILKSFNSTTSPVVAVAFDRRGHIIAQTLEPAALLFIPTGAFLLMDGDVQSVALSSDSRHNSGSDIFHTQAGGMIACASCDPEGGDDGHVWMLDGLPRRTPSLRGTIAGTAPYHWPGDELDMGMLVDDVYTRRMSGARLAPEQQQVLKSWVEGLPAPPAPSWVDASAAQRGQMLFEGPAGCSTCHSGAKFTNNATVDVGTGHDVGTTADGGAPPAAFQVPPLVGVGWRTPLMHNGCAATMADRFGDCATPGHGSTAHLSSQDIGDLTAYLESL
jgi:mono/diheme cytochrome c family protein